MLQHGKAVYNMVQLILDLAFVFVVHMGIAQMAELLRLIETPFQAFRRNKIFGH